ncbi:hypothetical protein GIV52_24195 [Pseudomonas syringae]|uniref:Uncharacterized protein n=1 Tax=Pseudomonas syringae TaxID=317 RepID=A0A9Q4A748_PSESX|nr:hypothetical protein [Pseudomonas syringae]MCF5473140.1 hypothetical protein [Pseudomonas syringae]MCF5483155.1 hypothetical protein [Pseudomonas syringae]MCF5487576.1 hypothetical protein [Pseudomonas syringae]MCF5492587.1 hypothetical protein [Pseudomonas syringae]
MRCKLAFDSGPGPQERTCSRTVFQTMYFHRSCRPLREQVRSYARRAETLKARISCSPEFVCSAKREAALSLVTGSYRQHHCGASHVRCKLAFDSGPGP